jgi:hypothetical protein
MTGRDGTRVRNALELITVPAPLLTIAEYAPTFAEVALLTVSVPVREPEIFPLSVKLVT